MDKLTTLHIGTTKTGSTSIQDFLAQNRDFLNSKGVVFPKALGTANHNSIPVYVQGKFVEGRLHARQNVKTEEDYEAFKNRLPEALKSEVAGLDPDHYIISNEHMHSRCFKPGHFRRLKTLLEPVLTGRKVQIVVYLRPQIGHVVSLYSTMLRNGFITTIDEFIESKMSGRAHDYFNFRVLLKLWSKAFPEATFVVRPFADMGGLEHGVLSDFLEVTDLAQYSDQMVFKPRQNESMGPWSAEALRQLNLLDPKLAPDVDRAARRWLRYELPSGRPQPSIDVARAFQDSYAKDNRIVCKKYFNGNSAPLGVDWSKYEAPPQSYEPKPEQLIALLQQISKKH